MMRLVGVFVTIALLIVGWFAYQDHQGLFGLSGPQTLQIVWLIMILLLLTGAGFGFRRLRGNPSTALAGLLFWPGALLVIVLLYNMFN